MARLGRATAAWPFVGCSRLPHYGHSAFKSSAHDDLIAGSCYYHTSSTCTSGELGAGADTGP